jgi:predicted RNA-binding protein
MILPEHKEALVRHREEITMAKPKRPVRDEFELEELAGRLQEAMEERRELVFTIWGRETTIRGRVVKMDADTKKVHIQNFGTVEKVPFLDILEARRPEF